MTKHHAKIKRINRIEGQVRGIKAMIEDERYCVDILQQVKAVRAALKQVGLDILEGHVRGCVAGAVSSKDPNNIDTKIEELTTLLKRWD